MDDDKLLRFNRLRDETLEGLVMCDFLLMPLEILKIGYKQVSFNSAVNGQDELELTVFEKDGDRMVFLQTYTEREGGMYFQSLFADADTAARKQKPI